MTLRSVPAIVAAVMLAACSSTGPDDDGDPAVASVEITGSVAELSPGESQVFAATAFDDGGVEIAGVSFDWSTSAPGVALVDQSGRVTAVGHGTATITAAAGGEEAEIALEVVTSWAAISMGSSHACGLSPDGAAYCWGDNTWGQLGHDGGNSSVPVAVAGGQTWKAISAGKGYTCAIDANDAGWCWGLNAAYQHGTPEPSQGSMPQLVPGGLLFSDLRAGVEHTCGVTTVGAGYCWGSNGLGELGIGTAGPPAGPTLVAGGGTWDAIDPNGSRMTCGLTTAGEGLCWGSGMLGSDEVEAAAPAPVDTPLRFTSVGTFFNGGCGLTAASEVHCWGEQSYGTVGSGGADHAVTPVEVAGSHGFTSLDAGDAHVCALIATGEAWCWGSNVAGAIGVPPEGGCEGGGPDACAVEPTAVSGGRRFAAISAGGETTCAVTAGGAGYCWGVGTAGQLGDGNAVSSHVPVRVRRPGGG